MLTTEERNHVQVALVGGELVAFELRWRLVLLGALSEAYMHVEHVYDAASDSAVSYALRCLARMIRRQLAHVDETARGR